MYCIVASWLAYVLRSIVERPSARSTSPAKLFPVVSRGSNMNELDLTKRRSFPDIGGDRFRRRSGTVVAAHSGAVGTEQKQFQDVSRRIVVCGRNPVKGQEAANLRWRAGQEHPSVGVDSLPFGVSEQFARSVL